MLFLFDNVVNAECLFELKHQSGSDSFDYGWGASFLPHFAVLQVAVIFFGHLQEITNKSSIKSKFKKNFLQKKLSRHRSRWAQGF